MFKLIKSLDKSEKRYLKLYAQFQKGDKVYMHIFNLLEKMDEYDDEKLQWSLKRKGIKIQQLSQAKNYLYNFILESLRYCHEKKSVNSQINNLLAEAKLLERKGLYKQFSKRLKIAKNLSEKYENHLTTLQILDEEIMLVLAEGTKSLETHIHQLNIEIEETVTKIQLEFEYKRLLRQLFTWYRTQNKSRDENTQRTIEELLEENLLKDVSKAKTFQTKTSYFFIHALAHHILGKDLNKANAYYEQNVKVWDEYLHMKEENPQLYKIHLSNYLNSCHSIHNYEPFPNILFTIEQIRSFSFDEEAEKFQNLLSLKLVYYMNTFQYNEAIRIIPDIKKGIIKYKSKINKARELTFYCNIAFLYFANEDFKETIEWIEKILDSKNSDHRKDIQVFAKVMQLIVHYELKNFLLLENLHRSTYRGLKKINKLHDFESMMLKLVKNLQNTRDKKEDTLLITSFLNSVEKLQRNGSKGNIVGLNEIIIWAKSKLNSATYLDTLRREGR